MNFRATILLLLVQVLVPAVAGAQTYELSGQWYTAKWPAGAWEGKHALPGVYCVSFPSPASAIDLSHGFYNKGGIYLTQVRYPEKLGVFIVASTIPTGQAGEGEVTRLLALERAAETAYGANYNIAETQTAFGRTIQMKIRNVAPYGRAAPFPLVRPMLRPAREPIETLSVHRHFVRGPDRFEVAAFQVAPVPANEGTEEEMTARLTAMADQTVAALQGCTAGMPVRMAR